MSVPGIAVEPFAEPGLVAAIERAGGKVVAAEEAAALIWTNPSDPEGLKELIARSQPRWVQLPFAGIEGFVKGGALDEDRIWTCAKGIYGHACAEHALALMLAAARRLHFHARNRAWVQPGLGSPERRLHDLTALVIGTGGIGGALAPMLKPLGVRIVGLNRSGRSLAGAEKTVASDRLLEVVPEADFVVLTCALTPETEKMINASVLDAMKDDAWLVNVARGGLVDTGALVAALQAGSIGGAALDVTEPEPLPEDHPLWAIENVLITPHVANTWDMGLPELRGLVERNVAHFAAEQELEGLVDVRAGY